MRRVGIDVVGVERFELAVKRSGLGFLRKAFTAQEIEYCGGDAERLAGRWAAKEAVIKCFDGTPICFPRRRIEVLPSAGGAPRVRLHGDARGASIELSITHHSGLAVASATLDMPGRGDLMPAPPGVRLPERPADGHKGTFGTVAVLAGSAGLTGAAYLCSTAAARAGAGMVRLLVPAEIYPILAVKCTEVMVEALPQDRVDDPVEERFQGARAALVGPGLGRDPGMAALAVRLATGLPTPAVLDADCLNALAADPAALRRLPPGRVLTPHPGEMARLLGRQPGNSADERREAASTAAREWGAVVVLKGAHTVVGAPDGRVAVDPHEVPALASGGTGDVLAGVIAALLAQGLEPFSAAVTGVYVHASAGRWVQERIGQAGLLASDLLTEIPLVQRAMREARS